MADTKFLKDNLSGAVPTEIAEEIIKNVINQASILKVAKRVPMTSDKKVLPRLANSGSASWVAEGEKIGTTLPTFEYPTLKACKLAVIVPVTREKMNDSIINVMGEVQQAIADAFAKAIDQAMIFGTNSPFDTNLLTSATAQKVTATGQLNEDISNAMGKVEDNKYICSDILMGTGSKKVIRALANDNKYKNAITMQSVFETPVEYVRDWEEEKGIAIVGDFSNAVVGTREEIEYQILDQATVEINGEMVNLAQRDLLGVKATIRLAFAVVDSKSFSLIATE